MNEQDVPKSEHFNTWNEKKQKLNASKRRVLFKEGEVRWCSFGMNIGEEVFGKGADFLRPALILKKFSDQSCIVLPLTSKARTGTWYFELNAGVQKSTIMLHQIRFVSAKRFKERMFSLPEPDFCELKKSVADLLGLFSIPSEPELGEVGNPKKEHSTECLESISSSISDANRQMLGILGESGRIEGMGTDAPKFTKTTPEFEAGYAKLNAEQKAAVDAINGPVFVVAGPGTGKTQVLALRIANILKLTDTPPEAILALTFTETGAREMRERISRLIGSTTAWKIRIHTFHGFAQSLISRFPEQFPRIVGAEIATDAERAEILESAILNANVKILRPYGEPLFYHYAVGQAISTMKRENVTLENLAERVREADAAFDAIPGKIHEKGKYEGKMKGEFETLQKKITRTRELMAVYELYQKGLEEKKRYDFEDVILEVVRAFEENDSAFKREVQEGILYVLADEHQDANKAQNALLEHLTDYDDHPNLFIVGDEKQAIYRFQGADLDNVHYFRERFTGTQVIVLTQNYRSTQTILDSALSLIAASPDERLSRLPLQAQKGGPTSRIARPITIATAPTPEAEVDFLAEEIQKLLRSADNSGADKKGGTDKDGGDAVAAEDIAILARRNRDVAYLVDALTKRGVPVAAGGEERNALANPYVMALRRFLEAVNEQRDERLSSILTLPGFKISAADAWRIMNTARASYVSAFQVLAKDDLLEQAMLIDKQAARSLYEKLVHLGNLASYERPAVVAQEAFRDTGLLEAMLNVPAREQHFGAIRAFFGLLEEISKREHDALLPRALQLLTLYDERGIPLKGKEDETLSAGRVKVMTAHKSKGREFKYVFVPRLTESAWSTRNRPEYFYLPDILSGATEIEDERRLLYVAMTRAKNHLTISYSLTRDDGKETAPSALVEDIDASPASALVEQISIKEREGVSADNIGADRIEGDKAEEKNLLEFLPDAGKPHSRAGESGAAPAARHLMISDDDRETLRNAFLAQGLSPTALNNYLQCPSKYFYVNLLRLPEPENKYMLFGTAIHAALKSYADRRTRGDDVPGDYIVTEFNRVLSKSPLSIRDLEDLKEKGKRALLAWWRENQVSWPSNAETEIPVEAPFALASGDTITVRGKLDRIDPLSGETVRVIDYKTGKPKSRKELEEGNYWRQLVFYKLLLARTDKPREMTEGVIEFVEPDDKEQMKKELFIITNEHVTELESDIQRVAQEIMTLSFWDAHCTEEDCEWCSLRFGLS